MNRVFLTLKNGHELLNSAPSHHPTLGTSKRRFRATDGRPAFATSTAWQAKASQSFMIRTFRHKLVPGYGWQTSLSKQNHGAQVGCGQPLHFGISDFASWL